MTFKLLKEIMERYHIPDNVVFMSDSGWECDATHMDGVYYCEEKNLIVFTQGVGDHEYTDGAAADKWKCLFPD